MLAAASALFVAAGMSAQGGAQASASCVHAADTTECVRDKGVVVMPSFPGGEKAMYKFIANTMMYPAVSQENGEQGRVIVTFTVKADGTIQNIRVVRSVSPALDKEAIRIVKAMPRWNPGTRNGIPVDADFTVPFSFRLS